MKDFGGKTMNYLEKIMEILQRATVEEIFMVLRFAENVVEGERKTGRNTEKTEREEALTAGG